MDKTHFEVVADEKPLFEDVPPIKIVVHFDFKVFELVEVFSCFVPVLTCIKIGKLDKMLTNQIYIYKETTMLLEDKSIPWKIVSKFNQK